MRSLGVEARPLSVRAEAVPAVAWIDAAPPKVAEAVLKRMERLTGYVHEHAN